MKKVIIDTNMLLVPGQFMVDIYGEMEMLMSEPYVLVVLDKTIQELTKLCEGKRKDAQAARLGLALLNARLAANPTLWEKLLGLVPKDRNERKVEVVKAKQYVDDEIVAIADEETIVATNDAELKKRLKKNKIKLIVLKSKKHLVFQ